MDIFRKIDQEREKLKERRHELAQQIAKIDFELADWDAADRVMQKLHATEMAEQIGPAFESAKAELQETIIGGAKQRPFGGTTKKLVLAIMRDAYPQGMNSADIREKAKKSYFREINKNTLTVTLVRLREDGGVRIDGKTWYYVPVEDQKADAPPEQSGEAP